MDIILIGGLLYFLMKYLKRRREQAAATASSGQFAARQSVESSDYASATRQSLPDAGGQPAEQELDRGLQQIRSFDQSFNEADFKEAAQDIFFRIQAAWMNRSLEGAEQSITDEMATYMAGEFASMKQKGQINRLENIAVRKVEIAEAWQESGKEYISVLFTANLLDYTVDEKSGEVVTGDRRNPVKFEEFWTFSRSIRGEKLGLVGHSADQVRQENRHLRCSLSWATTIGRFPRLSLLCSRHEDRQLVLCGR